MNKLNDERKTSFSKYGVLSFFRMPPHMYTMWEGEDRLTDSLALLHKTVVYLEGGTFFNAGVDDNMSFPRYSQTGNGQEQRTLTRWS